MVAFVVLSLSLCWNMTNSFCRDTVWSYSLKCDGMKQKEHKEGIIETLHYIPIAALAEAGDFPAPFHFDSNAVKSVSERWRMFDAERLRSKPLL